MIAFVNVIFYPILFGLIALIVFIQKVFKKKEDISNAVSKSILLLFSLIVVISYNWTFCLCLLGVILYTYFFALAIDNVVNIKRQNFLTVLAVVINIITLGIFKYFNFFMNSITGIMGRHWNDLDIILPIGISFYIFSSISYILDVSWKKMKADKSILNVALFLSFFPKMVCGPIARGKEFITQLQENKTITYDNFRWGIQVFVFGLFKKIVLADHIGLFVDQVYAYPKVFNSTTVWLAMFSYSLQLYFDFSGYSDMAIGISKIFGYQLDKK